MKPGDKVILNEIGITKYPEQGQSLRHIDYGIVECEYVDIRDYIQRTWIRVNWYNKHSKNIDNTNSYLTEQLSLYDKTPIYETW